jgi:hypothetical protein
LSYNNLISVAFLSSFSLLLQQLKHVLIQATQKRVYGNATSIAVHYIGCKSATNIFAISTYSLDKRFFLLSVSFTA